MHDDRGGHPGGEPWRLGALVPPRVGDRVVERVGHLQVVELGLAEEGRGREAVLVRPGDLIFADFDGMRQVSVFGGMLVSTLVNLIFTPGLYAILQRRAAAATRNGRIGVIVCYDLDFPEWVRAAALVHRAVGDRLTCIFVDHGLLRLHERDQVEQTFRRNLGIDLAKAFGGTHQLLSFAELVFRPTFALAIDGFLSDE